MPLTIQITPELLVITTYVRLVCLASIFLTSLIEYRSKYGIAKRILLGDFVVALVFFLSLLHTKIFYKNDTFFLVYFNTPVLIFWASTHFKSFLEVSSKKLEK